MSRPAPKWIAILCNCFALALAAPIAPRCEAAEIQPAAAIGRLEIGLAGQYKLGFWTPVTVTLAGGPKAIEADLQIIVPDGDGVPTRVVERGVRIPAGEKVRVRSFVKIGQAHSGAGKQLRPTISVSLGTAQDSAAFAEHTFDGEQIPPALPATQQLILEVGGSLDFGNVVRFNEEGRPEETAVAYVEDPRELPEQWFGYDAVDTMFITTAKPEAYGRISAAAVRSIRRWNELGGRLVLSVGRNAPNVFADTPLGQLAPGKFKKLSDLRRLGTLESFAAASERIDENAGAVKVAQLSHVRGRIEAFEGDRAEELPLVVRWAVGFGQAVFVAVDLDEPPISVWRGRPQFLAALLGRNSTVAESSSAATTAVGARLGYDDLSGQLRSSLDQFPDVEMTPFWLVALLAAAYVLLLFPLDYFLFSGRRRARGAAWPWVRFGVFVAAVSLGAWLMAARSKGDKVRTTAVEVLDYDLESHLARGSAWLGLYSPRTAQYDIQFSPTWHGPHDERSEVQLSWLGLPGGGLGGMSATTAELPQFSEPYAAPALSDRIGPVPLPTWSSRCFSARWINADARLVEADLRETEDRQLAGTIRVLGGDGKRIRDWGWAPPPVPFHLTDCILFHDRWAYVIPPTPDGKPALSAGGEPLKVTGLDPLTAETLLTHRRSVGGQVETPPYDRAGVDRERILEVMLFYREAGGRRYSGLLDRYQQFLDLSGQLGLDRAILVGRGPPAARWTLDGQPLDASLAAEPLTIYRFVIPVRPFSAAAQ